MSKPHKRQRRQHCILKICGKSKNHFYLKNRTSDRKLFRQDKTCDMLTTKKLDQIVENRSISSKKKSKNTKRKKKINAKPIAGPLQYVFYAIVNTNVCMDKGTTSATVGQSLIALHSKLDSDEVKYQYVDTWTKSGQNIIILQGYDHKHLRYLQEEVKYAALGTHALIKNWDGTRQILVLSIFGLTENLEESLGGLSLLK